MYPGSLALSKCIRKNYTDAKGKLMSLLNGCRSVTVCLDGWTAKGLAKSYLGISVCFFDPATNQPKHATLNLSILPHPHTGEAIADTLTNSLQQWNISCDKVLMVISDNGASVVKAIRLMQQNEKEKQHNILENVVAAEASEEGQPEGNEGSPSEADDSEQELPAGAAVAYEDMQAGSTDEYETGTDNNSGSEDSDEGEANEESDFVSDGSFGLPDSVPFRRMPCIAHTLQLVIKEAYKKRYVGIISRTRQLVAR